MARLEYDYDALVPASPPRFSLVSQAQRVVDGDDGQGNRWAGGFVFWPEVCHANGSVFWQCAGDGGADSSAKTIPSGRPPLVHYTPYTAWVGEQCAPVGGNQAWFIPRATRALAACVSTVIEKELWDGAVATTAAFPNRYLNMVGSVNNLESNAPLGVISAVAEMEQALAACSCGGQHMIHAQPRTVTHMVAEHLVRADGNRLRTELGTIVVPGGGYSGSGPNGEPTGHANHSWIYGTSMVSVFLGPVTILPRTIDEALNRETNLVEYRAERDVAAVWDGCCHIGVKVDHTATRTAYGS